MIRTAFHILQALVFLVLAVNWRSFNHDTALNVLVTRVHVLPGVLILAITSAVLHAGDASRLRALHELIERESARLREATGATAARLH